MASYPTAVKTFTTKNSGDTLQPADVNDLQAEVNAIEAGLLNGTANLNSSNSTVNNLSVLGNATITGTLAVNGGGIAGPFPYARVTNSAKQDIPTGAWSGLNWDTEVVDGSNLHSTSANSSRITFTSSGSWLVGGSVTFNPNSSGSRQVRLLVNDTTTVAYIAASALPGAHNLSVSGLWYTASTTDYVVLTVFQDSGSTGSVQANSLANPSAFWAQRVSA